MSILFEVQHLSIDYVTGKTITPAVQEAHLRIAKGSVHCVVGESGSGKTTLALSLIGLLPRSARVRSGEVFLQGVSYGPLAPHTWKKLRGKKIGFVFQDPLNALHPLYTVGDQIVEAIVQTDSTIKRIRALLRAGEILGELGIKDVKRVLHAYPHELSGGLRQRIVIAIAIAMNPDLIVCDEPTTALDVTVQEKIVTILRRLADQGKAILFITHDLGVVAQIADTVSVMYQGRIVEEADVYSLFGSPAHDYTQSLLASAARLAN